MNDDPQVSPFGNDFISDCRNTSVPLEGGGDTHMHLNRDRDVLVVTTRLPDGAEDHNSFSIPDLMNNDR